AAALGGLDDGLGGAAVGKILQLSEGMQHVVPIGCGELRDILDVPVLAHDVSLLQANAPRGHPVGYPSGGILVQARRLRYRRRLALGGRLAVITLRSMASAMAL